MRLISFALVSILPLVVWSNPLNGKAGTSIKLEKRSSLVTNGVVNITALMAHKAHVLAKIQRGFKNFEKNTGAPHPRSRKTEKRATASVPLTDDHDFGIWQGTVQVGTPANTFTVDFDTGSTDFFLPGNQCTGPNCRGHTLFNPSSSRTARDTGLRFSIIFGDGSSVSGEQFSDTVILSGLASVGQRVGVASTYSNGFSPSLFPPDGLMGLAFPQISVFGSNSVFASLVAQGETTMSIFSVKLTTGESELFLGGTNPTKFTGSIIFTPLTTVGFWEVTVQGLTVGSSMVVRARVGIVDTGTTFLIGDTTSVRAVYAAIPGATDAARTVGEGFFTVPCNAVPTNIGLVFNGQTYTMSSGSFNLGPVSDSSADCVGGLVADDSVGFWVFGDVFLQNVYSVFDVGNLQLGFARLK